MKPVNIYKPATLFLCIIISIFISSCSLFHSQPDNNHKTIPDLIIYFRDHGIEIQKLSLVRRDIAHADDAIAIMIDGREIGVYKYDLKVEKQKEKIDKARENGFTYLVGIEKPTVVNGSFMLIGHDSNKQKDKIVKVFKSFK